MWVWWLVSDASRYGYDNSSALFPFRLSTGIHCWGEAAGTEQIVLSYSVNMTIMACIQDLQLNMGSEHKGGGFYFWYYGSVILVDRRVSSCEHIYMCVCVCVCVCVCAQSWGRTKYRSLKIMVQCCTPRLWGTHIYFISFIFFPWICTGLQNPYGYGNSHICLRKLEVNIKLYINFK